MEQKLAEVPLQPLMKSSEAEDEKAVAHDQVEVREASQGGQEQNKGQHWLKRCLSQKGMSIFIAVTTMLGYILLYLAMSVIAPFYPIWVSLTKRQCWLARYGGVIAHTSFHNEGGQTPWHLPLNVMFMLYSILNSAFLQALKKGANLIIAGFVIGMAGLSVTVFSPILGVCVSLLAPCF